MVDIGILLRAQQENERLKLGLTVDQIIAALQRREQQAGQVRPARGRPASHPDPVGEQACARADKDRQHGRAA